MALSATDVHVTTQQGAKVLILRDPSFPIVHFTLAWRHGAAVDAAEARGALATLLPLLLRGTQDTPRSAFNAALEALGSSVDTAVGHEMATLSGTSLTANLAATLALLAEALRAPALDPDELQALCEESRQGLLSERDDDETVADLFLRRAYYGTHRLAQPADGSVASLGRLTRAHVIDVQRHLVAERLVVALAGDVAPAQAEAALAPLLTAIDRPAPPAPALAPPTAPTRGRIVLVDKPERTQVQLRVARPGVSVRDPDSDAFWLGIMAFGGTFTSPLTREVRDVRGWSYFAHADFRRRSLFASPVVLRSAPAVADAVDCLALKLDLFAALGRGELAREHLELAKAYLLGRLPLQTATVFDLLGPAVTLEVLGLGQDALWDTAAKLEALDLNTVGAVMRRHLGNTAATAVLVGPKEALLAPLQQRFADYEVVVQPYTEGLEA